MLSDSTAKALARMARDCGYDTPAARPARAPRCEPPGIYGWAEVIDRDGEYHVVRACGMGMTPPGDTSAVPCVDAGSGQRVHVPRSAFVRRLPSRDACLTAGFAEVEKNSGPETADPWWVERRRNPAFIAAFDYAHEHPELPTTGRLIAMRAAKRDDDHGHGGMGPHRSHTALSRFGAQVQRSFDAGDDIVEALHEWVLGEAAQDYWWYDRYVPVLQPETVWRRWWRDDAVAIAARVPEVVEQLRLRGLARRPPVFSGGDAVRVGVMVPVMAA